MGFTLLTEDFSDWVAVTARVIYIFLGFGRLALLLWNDFTLSANDIVCLLCTYFKDF